MRGNWDGSWIVSLTQIFLFTLTVFTSIVLTWWGIQKATGTSHD